MERTYPSTCEPPPLAFASRPIVRSRIPGGPRPVASAPALADDCPIGRVVSLLRRHTRLSVCLAGSDWDEVDRARDSLDAAGLTDRVSVHHASALTVASALVRRAAS